VIDARKAELERAQASVVLAQKSYDRVSQLAEHGNAPIARLDQATDSLHEAQRNVDQAKSAYEQAVNLGSTSAHSYYRAAQLAWKPTADAALLTDLRTRLEKAIEFNGAYASAYSYLAEVLVEMGDGPAALPRAERAVVLEPAQSYHRVALARALNKLGRADEAPKSAELGLKLATDDAERSNAQRFLLFLNESAFYAQDRAQHDAWVKQSCLAGDGAACAQVLPDMERACGGKEAGACLYLSSLYASGRGLSKDVARAASYAGQACDAGDKRGFLIGSDGINVAPVPRPGHQQVESRDNWKR